MPLKSTAKKLAFVLDAAADNRGTGALQRAMDAMSSPNSMHDCITGTKSACPAVEEDLQRDWMLLLLEQMRSGKGLPRLTANLKNLRLAERAEREKTRAMKNLQTRVQTEQAAKPTAATAETAQPPQRTIGDVIHDLEVGEDNEWMDVDEPTGADGGTDLLKRLQSLMEDVQRAQQAVIDAKAKLSEECAADLAQHGVATGAGSVVRTRPIELDVSGPVMRRSCDVIRIFNLYEEKLKPFLETARKVRWIARRWYCWTQLRVKAKLAGTEYFRKREMRMSAYQQSGRGVYDQPALCSRKARQPVSTIERGFRIRAMRMSAYEQWGRSLYGQKGQDGQEGPDWKHRHLKCTDCGQVSFDRYGWKRMFERQRGPLSNAEAVVSMHQNPARFWPCKDQRVNVLGPESPAAQSAPAGNSPQGPAGAAATADPGPTQAATKLCHTGHVQQCGYHSQHNSVEDFFKFLDIELFSKVISTVKALKNHFIGPELIVAINFLLSDDPKVREGIDSKTEFFKKAREGIEAQAARSEGISLKEARAEIGFIDGADFSAESAETCAIVRWATVCKSAAWLCVWRRAVAFGLLRIGGIGLNDSVELDAVISIFSHDGFVSSKHPDLFLENKVSGPFLFLVHPATISQLAIVRCVYILVVQPLMMCMSENNECSERMTGMDSVPRRLLLVLSRGVFVSTGEWSRHCRLGHRSHGAEFEKRDGVWRHGCVRLMCGPMCASRIRRMLGNDWDQWGDAVVDKIAMAVPDLLKTFSVLALKQGKVMPQTAERVFELAYGENKLYGSTDETLRNSSYALRMLALQILFTEVVHNVIQKLEDTLRHELQGAKGFMAGIARTKQTFGEVRCRLAGREATLKGPLVYAHPMSGPNAVITLLMGQEVLSHFTQQLAVRSAATPSLRGRDPLDFFPAFASGLWCKEGMDSIRQLLGISDGQRSAGTWGQHHNRLDSLTCVDDQGGEQSSVRVQLLAESPTRPPPEAGLKDWNWVDELPRPPEEFKVAFKWAEIAAKLSNSGKPIEGAWAWPALAFEGRSSMRVQGLNGYFTSYGHKSPGLDPQSLAKTKLEFRTASELAQFSGWNRVLSVDRELRSVMRKDYQRITAIKAARAGGWSTTNHRDEYREDKYANPKGKKKTTEQNRRTKLVQNILQRMSGTDKCITKRPNRRPQPRRTVGTKSRISGQARKSLKEMVQRARSTAASERRRSSRAVKCAGPTRPSRLHHRQSTGHGGDEDEWEPPTGGTAGVASQLAAETEKRCTRQTQRERVTSSESHVSSSGPESASVLPGPEAPDSEPQSEVSESSEGDLDAPLSNGRAAPGTNDNASESSSGEDFPLVVLRKKGGKGPAQPADPAGPDVPASRPGPKLSRGSCADASGSLVCLGAAKVAAKPSRKRGGSTAAKGKSRKKAPSDTSDSDNDVTVLAMINQKRLNPEQQNVEFDTNPWSADFAIGCSHLCYYGNPSAPYPVWMMKERDTAVFSTSDKEHEPAEATITRRQSRYLRILLGLKECAVPTGITFRVRARSDRHYYLKFDDWAGALIVKVEKIMAPNPDARDDKAKWKETMSFRRVFDTQEAVAKSKDQRDRGQALGGKAMKELWRREMQLEKDTGQSHTTYHVGDCRYVGDIRTLVGVVRWKSERAQDLAEDYFSEYPDADEVTTGADVVQNSNL